MAGIWGEGPRGGIFGTRIDPALLRELEQRAEVKRQEMAQPQMLRPYDAARDVPRSNPDGSVSTEITRTVQTPEGWANVPSLWFGGRNGPRDFGGLDDDQLSALAQQYERMSKQKFPRFKSIEEAEDTARKRSRAGGATRAPLAKKAGRE